MAPEMQSARSVRGRTAIVTGAGSGMGRATARLLAADGASVVAVDRNQAGLDGLAESLSGDAKLHAVVADLTEGGAVGAIVAAAHDTFGRVDIVINAAGVSAPIELSDPDFFDMWRFTFAVNVDAQVELIAACLDDLCRNGDGRVVNIASTEGLGATSPMAPW